MNLSTPARSLLGRSFSDVRAQDLSSSPLLGIPLPNVYGLQESLQATGITLVESYRQGHE